MPKIKSPNLEYNGVSASLTFVKGEAETDDKWLQEWFKNKGYEVIDTNDSNDNDNKNVNNPDDDGQKQRELTNDQLREELDKLGAEYKASDNKDELKEKLAAAQEKTKAE
jgi:hypothetical protein